MRNLVFADHWLTSRCATVVIFLTSLLCCPVKVTNAELSALTVHTPTGFGASCSQGNRGDIRDVKDERKGKKRGGRKGAARSKEGRGGSEGRMTTRFSSQILSRCQVTSQPLVSLIEKAAACILVTDTL